MKNAKVSVILFLAAFVLTYIGTCYLVPGWRIKLAADHLTYFLASLQIQIGRASCRERV